MASVIERLSRQFREDDLRATLGDDGGARAAVAAILRPGDAGEEILFIKRATREGDPWSGHMAFPGGRAQKADATLLDTAARETLEEVGIDLRALARPIARLPDVMPYSRMPFALTVTAFVFSLERPATLALNDEVANAVWSPLDPILRGEGATTFRYVREGAALELPAFNVEGGVVWGLTYRMIELLRETLTPR